MKLSFLCTLVVGTMTAISSVQAGPSPASGTFSIDNAPSAQKLVDLSRGMVTNNRNGTVNTLVPTPQLIYEVCFTKLTGVKELTLQTVSVPARPSIDWAKGFRHSGDIGCYLAGVRPGQFLEVLFPSPAPDSAAKGTFKLVPH